MEQFTINGTYKDNQLVKVEDIQVELANGVYILHTNGTLYTKDEWDTSWNSQAVGVAVKTDKCQFVIAPTEYQEIRQQYPDKVLIDGATVASDLEVAKTDYNGLANTQAGLTQIDPTEQCAILVCGGYLFKNGKTGYLPALGELLEARSFKNEVDSCMDLIGGTPLYSSDLANPYKWSSTQEVKNRAWYTQWNLSYTAPATKLTRTKPYCARPFTTL